MIDIAISGLVKEFEVGKKILDGLTFQVDSGERVGLLGKNGCGKTTLLRILTGQLDWDEGEVVLPPDKRVGLISQIPVYPAGYTVEDVLDTAFRPLREMEEEMEQLAARMERGEDPALLRRYDQLTAAFEAGGGYDTDTRKNKVCSGLQIGPGMREQLFDRLSGGEKTRVNLGRLILEDTDILLLDEPTNHLDLKATEWLEEYLDKFKGTVLAVSHDRWFLDRVVDRVIEIQEGKAEFYSGNYSFYVVEKERRYQEKLKQYEKEQAKIQQLEKAAEQLRIWAYSGNDKIFKRAQSMEKRIERMRTTDRPTRERKMEVRFGEREFRGDEVLTIKGLSKSFGQRALFSGVDLEVVGGERIALLGDNGTGKSTLIKILMGEEGPDEGKIRMGPTVKIGYLPQIIHFDHPERSLLDTMLYELDCTAQTARNRLASFKFRRGAVPAAAVHAHGREDQPPDSGRAHQPPGHPEPGVDRGGGGGVRGQPALRLPRPLLHRPLRHPGVGAGGRAGHRLPGQLRRVPGSPGEEAGPGRPRPRGGAGGEEGEAPAARRHQEPGEGGGRRRAGGG